MYSRVLSASTIKGTNVINLDGEHIGEIQDLMINLENGEVVYAVLSFGGFLGIGDKLFAVPLEALQFSLTDHDIVLDVNRETLENAPGFDKDNWPADISPEFVESVYSHYGYEEKYRRPTLRR